MQIPIRNLFYVFIVLLFAALLAGCSQNDSSSIKAVHEDQSKKRINSKGHDTKEKKSSTISTSSFTTKIDTMTIDVPPPPEP